MRYANVVRYRYLLTVSSRLSLLVMLVGPAWSVSEPSQEFGKPFADPGKEMPSLVGPELEPAGGIEGSNEHVSW